MTEQDSLSTGLLSAPADIGRLAETIAPFPRIGVDTEADSMHCYFEKLCLIQISVPGCDALVDPLAEGIDLTPLWRVLSEREIILQGADYDLRLLRRNGFDRPKSVFDTMLAARLAGIEQFSLAALLKRYFGVELAKGSQKADWARRPLTPTMAEYARNDTRYLIELTGILERELEEKGRIEWFHEWCERAIEQASEVRERDPDLAWRITGSSKLNPRAAAILRGLWQWRDQEAQRTDRPTFHILGNQQLIDVATRIDHGKSIQFPKMKDSRFRRFTEAAEAAIHLPESEWPVKRKGIGRPRLTPEQDALVRDYKKKRDVVAQELSIDSSIIASRSVLENLALDREDAWESLMSWQRELLAQAGV